MEHAMMDELVKECKSRGIKTIYGYYYPTLKNKMVADFYDKQEFELIREDSDLRIYFYWKDRKIPS